MRRTRRSLYRPSADSEALITRIAEAWADVPYPGDEYIATGWQRDGDFSDTLDFFTGRHWRDLLIRPHRPSQKKPRTRYNIEMSFLDARAWHFFLPAYLINAVYLKSERVFVLTPCDSARLQEFWRERAGRLSSGQCAAIQCYLSYVISGLSQSRVSAEAKWAAHRAEKRQMYLALTGYWQGMEKEAQAREANRSAA